MLSTINVTIQNAPYLGGIEIISTTSAQSIGNVSSIVINRKSVDRSTWVELQTISVSSVDDLSFDLFDIGTLSGYYYIYSIDIKNSSGNILETQTFSKVQCSFEGVFVGNALRQYMGMSSVEVSETRNTQVQYVTTLADRTPHRVSNANTNYTTGKVSALFMKLTDDKRKFVPDYDHTYVNEVIDFLSDGSGKIIKTTDGRGWYASIDTVIDKAFNDYYNGYNKISFSFTEIGDVPAINTLVEVE